MATVVNERDLLLEGVSPRWVNSTSCALLLTTDTPAFHVSTGGAGSPTLINITANLVMIPGTVTWSVLSGASGITASGNSCTLAFAAMTAASATVQATITYNTVTYTQTVVIAKVLDGSSGAIAYSLIVPTVVFQLSGTTFTPANETIQAMSQTGSTAPVAYAGRFEVYENGSLIYTSAADEASHVYTPTSSSVTNAKVELYMAGGTTNLLDTQTMAVVTNGTAGADAYIAILTNENATFPCDSSGTILSGLPLATTLQVYKGATLLSSGLTFSVASSSGCTTTINASTGVASVTALSADSASAIYQCVVSGGPTLTKALTLSKAKAGVTGTPGSPGSPGTPGAAGPQNVTVYAFQWSNAGAGAHSQSFSYTWSGGAISAYPSGWTASAGAAPGSGYTLYTLVLPITDPTGIAASTGANWSSASVSTLGYRQDGSIGLTGSPGATGASGNSSFTAYQVNTSSSAPGSPGTVAGNSAPSGWTYTASSSLSSGQYMWQVDGSYNPNTGFTSWGNPYLSNLKVGSLSALAADLGVVTISSVGSLSSGVGYGGAGGFFLGYSGGYKFSVLNSSGYGLSVDTAGSTVNFSGSINTTGYVLTGGANSSNPYGMSTSGFFNSTNSATYGVAGYSGTNGGAAIYGHNTSTGASSYGMYGVQDGSGAGIYGWASSVSSAGASGVTGACQNGNQYGVMAYNYGSGTALYCSGHAEVTGVTFHDSTAAVTGLNNSVNHNAGLELGYSTNAYVNACSRTGGSPSFLPMKIWGTSFLFGDNTGDWGGWDANKNFSVSSGTIRATGVGSSFANGASVELAYAGGGYLACGTRSGGVLTGTVLNIWGSQLVFGPVGGVWHVMDQYGCLLAGYGTSAGTTYKLQSSSQIAATNASIYVPSDARLKENIAPLESCLAQILLLEPVTFTYKPSDQFKHAEGTQIGFIAQEVERVLAGEIYLDQIIHTSDSREGEVPNQKIMGETHLIPLLVKAVQELKTEIDELKGR